MTSNGMAEVGIEPICLTLPIWSFWQIPSLMRNELVCFLCHPQCYSYMESLAVSPQWEYNTQKE